MGFYNKIRYKRIIIFLLFVGITACVLFLFSRPDIRKISEKEESVIVVSADKSNEILPWYSEKEDCYYYFLPSFTTEEEKTRISENTQIDDTVVMKGENIPSLFITTEGGDNNYINADKSHVDDGVACIINSDGITEYYGEMSIHGRGNSSWTANEKKPYKLNLKEAAPVLGMSKGKEYCLINLFIDESKLSTVVVNELSEMLGLEYTPETRYVDLYMNGSYLGLYLLSETVSIDKGRVELTDLDKINKKLNGWKDLSVLAELPVIEDGSNKGYKLENGSFTDGGYIIEKDYPKYYAEENVGFTTAYGNCFSMKAPKSGSIEQVNYISDIIQRMENSIETDQPDYDLIDLKSFADRYLIEELQVDFDAGVTSRYFYKKSGSNKIYAGPVWDSDSCFGHFDIDWFQSYSTPIVINRRDVAYDWYMHLVCDETFMNMTKQELERILPELDKLVNERLYEYMNTILQSVLMDDIRNNSNHDYKDIKYREYPNNVRYLAFFINERINMLCTWWGIEHTENTTIFNSEIHTLTFKNGDETVAAYQVPDGYLDLDELPDFDDEIYRGWYSVYNDNKFNLNIPILEDGTYILK